MKKKKQQLYNIIKKKERDRETIMTALTKFRAKQRTKFKVEDSF